MFFDPIDRLFCFLATCDNGNQDVAETLFVDMQCGRSCEQPVWPIAGIIVQKWSASQQLFLEIGEFRAVLCLPLIVLSAYAQRDTIPFWDDDRCRPYFNREINGVARLQSLHFVMGVVRTVRSRQGFIELAMRSAQPALCDRCVRVNRTCESHLTHIRTKNPEDGKDIGVLGAGRNS